MSRLKVQLGLLAIFVFNLCYQISPGSWARGWFLRILGCRVGKGVGLHRGVRFTWPSRLEIGDDSTVNFQCILDTRGRIVIGKSVMVGHRCGIYTATHNLDSPDFEKIEKSVQIKDYAVIFPNSIVMPGVSIGTGAVVLPGSVVTKSIEDYSVVGGNPARHLRFRNKNLSYKHKYNFLFTNA